MQSPQENNSMKVHCAIAGSTFDPATNQLYGPDINDVLFAAVGDKTTGNLSKDYWKHLPKMADYYDLSEIDDSELVEAMLIQSTSKQGW